ncbi:LOW QUALITY PROTEIN: N-cym protein-like [Enhydra lutris kenyoni]|uniref:LOW QUALITY PROTEIN: N-cym protein-like n=1 Tax=Enhydra lutris kenyoni TaxID=391180 RepID=A0A2Y9K6U9_ENHLU|nr:LOW QUALITY PROTEIN: N-cym protein-like [Enhydra lutris kenyoni]
MVLFRKQQQSPEDIRAPCARAAIPEEAAKLGKPGVCSSLAFRPPGLHPVHSANQLRAERCNAAPTLRVEAEASHPTPAPTALCSAERDACVEPGPAVGSLVCDLEGRLHRGCRMGGGGGGRAHLGTRPQDVSSFKLKGEGRPPCLKINK